MRQGRGGLEMIGGVRIQGLRESHTEAIIDVIMVDPECDTNKNNPMGTLLPLWEKENIDKHGKH